MSDFNIKDTLAQITHLYAKVGVKRDEFRGIVGEIQTLVDLVEGAQEDLNEVSTGLFEAKESLERVADHLSEQV